MLEVILGLFLIGSFGFWIILSLCFLLLCVLVDNESIYSTSICLIIFGVMVWCSNGTINIFNWMADNWLFMINCTIFYIVMGFVTSAFKTYLTDIRIKNKLTTSGKTFVFDQSSTLEEKVQWKSFIRSQLEYKESEFIFDGPNKKQIVLWMAYWPITLISSILTDALKNFFTALYDIVLRGTFNKIHHIALGDTLKYKGKDTE